MRARLGADRDGVLRPSRRSWYGTLRTRRQAGIRGSRAARDTPHTFDVIGHRRRDGRIELVIDVRVEDAFELMTYHADPGGYDGTQEKQSRSRAPERRDMTVPIRHARPNRRDSLYGQPFETRRGHFAESTGSDSTARSLFHRLLLEHQGFGPKPRPRRLSAFLVHPNSL